MRFQDNVQDIRNLLGFTQTEMAYEVGVTRRTVSRFENMSSLMTPLHENAYRYVSQKYRYRVPADKRGLFDHYLRVEETSGYDDPDYIWPDDLDGDGDERE